VLIGEPLGQGKYTYFLKLAMGFLIILIALFIKLVNVTQGQDPGRLGIYLYFFHVYSALSYN